MKSTIAATLITLLTSLSAFAEKQAPSIIVKAPEPWIVEFQKQEGMQFFTITLKEENPAMLMLSLWPAAGSAKQIPDLVGSLRDAFLAQVKGNKQVEITSTKHPIKNINGDTYSGNFVKFEVKGGFVQTMFMIGQDEEMWNGQFTGTEKQWTDALAIIEKIEKKE